MLGQVFRSRWGALIIVMIFAASAAALIGTEGNSGALLNAADGIARQQAEMDEQIRLAGGKPDAEPRHERVMMDFTPEDELVDDAQGIDPTPVEEEPIEPDVIAQDDDVVIVLSDDDTGQ